MNDKGYPVNLNITGKRCVVVGGGEVAARKALSLCHAGARVSVISPSLAPALERLWKDGQIEHIPRSYQDGDLAAAFLAIAATDDEISNQAVAAEALRRNVLINVADDPARCDFTIPAVLRRGDLSIAVATGSRSPATARFIREDLEGVLSEEYAILLEIAAEIRAELRSQGKRISGENWRAALRRENFISLIKQGKVSEARLRLSEHLNEVPARVTERRGFVSLVGAGPGDPELITIKGVDRLRRAEVVVYDHLINERLLGEVSPAAELIYVGKLARQHTLRQSEINALLIARAREGKNVVRLKGGDPFVFGRGGEEAQELAAAGIPFEIVPGVTSAVAVPAYAGIPVTHRAYASSFAVITGHEDSSKTLSRIDWQKLATGVDTLVCMMGAQNLSNIVEQLMLHGRPAETPIALIRWGTWPTQETLVGTLATVVNLATERQFGAPAIAIIGEVVRLREAINWLAESPCRS